MVAAPFRKRRRVVGVFCSDIRAPEKRDAFSLNCAPRKRATMSLHATRREFIGQGLSFAALGLAAPQLSAISKKQAPQILVVIELAGGNDGLNTVVPFKMRFIIECGLISPSRRKNLCQLAMNYPCIRPCVN